jgi:hypothetical protein
MKNIHLTILKRLLSIAFPEIKTKSFFRPFVLSLLNMIKNWGIIYTIKYYKQMRLHCTRYMCGEPLLTNNMSIGLTKDGWPKKLLFLKPFVDSQKVSALKFVLTILNFSRSFILSEREWEKVKPNYKTITDKSSGNFTIPSGFINKWVENHRMYQNHPSFSKDSVYLSCKAGPQGPATMTSLDNLLLYNYDEMQNIMNLTDQNGQDFFCQSYTLAFEKGLTPKIKFKGKISFVKDPEAKLRIIAISDYYTQLFLKPIHEKVLNILKHLPCDRTFTQEPFHKWECNDEKFWSLDLSAATDRFPIGLQRRLLTRIFNEKLAHSWHWLLTNREFVTPEDESVKYSTGQPMGTYSSWAVFTLTHHMVVHFCASIEGYSNFDQYIILGDDIVIKNNKVAKRYIDVMSKLGVEISTMKTHVSIDTYEFAKRWIKPFKNVEITGIPLKGIIHNFKNPIIVYTILYDYFKLKNNLYLSTYSLDWFVRRLFYKLFIMTKKNSKKKTVKGNLQKRYLSINYKQFNKIRSFGLALDINFNNFNYEKVRKLFVNNITNDEYPIPGNGVALLEYKRILLSGMSRLIGSMNEKIISNPKLLLSKFSEEDKNLLSINPVFISIFNTIKMQWEIVKGWDLSDDISLHNASKEIVGLDIESIFNKDRNKIQSLLVIGQILKYGFTHINKTTEIYYGSSWTESTFTAPTDSLKLTQLNYKLGDLDLVMRNEWKPSRTAEDYISMWEQLK